MNGNQTSKSRGGLEVKERERLGAASEERSGSGREDQRSPQAHTSSGPESGSSGGGLEADGDHQRGRRGTGIPPTVRDVERFEEEIVQAFQEGQPAIAWAATQRLLKLAKETVVEAAQARFKANFGTSVCSKCEGLNAGPGVTATCFQLSQCYYTNFREDTLTLRQQRVIQNLAKF